MSHLCRNCLKWKYIFPFPEFAAVFIACFFQCPAPMMPVDYLKIIVFLRVWSDHYRLISPAPFYITNQLGEIPPALPVRIIRMPNKLI